MKKITLFCLLAAVMLFAASCRHSEKTIVFQNYEYEDNPFAETDDTVGVQFSIKIQLPLLEKATEAQRPLMQAMTDSLLTRLLEPYYNGKAPDQAIKDYCDSIRGEFNDWALLDDPTESGTPNYQWIQELSLVPELETEQMLVYNGSIYAYTGGEHPSTTTLLFLFDLNTGKQLTEQELFTWAGDAPNSESYNAFVELMKGMIRKMCDATDDFTADDIDWDNVAPNGNFKVTKDALVYHFDVYEITNTNAGPIDIVLPNHEVKQFMKEGTVLYNYWFKK